MGLTFALLLFRSLSNEEVNKLQSIASGRLVDEMGLELR